MLLAADIGNTQTHLGIYNRDDLTHQWRASTDARRTADEWALLFGHFLELADFSFSRHVTGVVVASVVPRASQELRRMVTDYFGFAPVIVEPGVRTGIAIKTDDPREVGADRIANAVAAHALYPDEDVIVVDFGTAITIDAVTSAGEFVGGAIAPGIETGQTALVSAAAQLRRVELEAPDHPIGKSTVTSVQSGLIYGTASMIDGMAERISKELGGDARVIATGGLAPVIAELCHRIEEVEPTLTLFGLRVIFERNAG